MAGTTVFQATSGVDAHLVQQLLERAGIEAQVMGEYLTGGMGELPAAGLVRVVVADEDAAEARKIIAEWDAGEVSAEWEEGQGPID